MAVELAYISDWRSDETLYSWISCFHAVHGNGSARDTGALLFESEHACRDRDAPRNLHHFVRATHSTLGDVQSLLLTRTPIGLFIPFLSASRQQKLNEQLETSAGPGWRLLCGMPASGLHDTSEMRYCEDCIADDVEIWGLPRWRMPHQLPGSWICLDHSRELSSLRTDASHWVLPPIDGKADGRPALEHAQAVALERIASLALRLIGAGTLDVGAIRQAVLMGLRVQGVTTWLHTLDNVHLSAWFSGSAIADWLRRSDGPWQRLASGDWIHDLLRNRIGDHPLKWMILWCTLFSDHDCAASHRRFLDPVSSPHWDASGQATIWGATPPSLPADIHDVIANAATLSEAASILGISVTTLRHRLTDLGTNPRAFRQDASFEQRKQRAVNAIRDYITAHPSCSRADIHKNCKAAVSWIRLNAPDVFEQTVGSMSDQRARQMTLMPDEFWL